MLSQTSFRRFLAPEISVLRVALSVAFVYAAVAAGAWLISDRMIFLPPPPSYRDTPDVLRLPTADGERIAAVYLPNPTATYSLLVSHGNGEDLDYVLPSLPPMRQLGFRVFAYDYRGYGLSEGRASAGGAPAGRRAHSREPVSHGLPRNDACAALPVR